MQANYKKCHFEWDWNYTISSLDVITNTTDFFLVYICVYCVYNNLKITKTTPDPKPM